MTWSVDGVVGDPEAERMRLRFGPVVVQHKYVFDIGTVIDPLDGARRTLRSPVGRAAADHTGHTTSGLRLPFPCVVMAL